MLAETNVAEIYVSTYGALLLQIKTNIRRINSQNYMLSYPVLHDISMDTYKIVRFGRKIQHYILDFHRESTASR